MQPEICKDQEGSTYNESVVILLISCFRCPDLCNVSSGQDTPLSSLTSIFETHFHCRNLCFRLWKLKISCA